jgi:hypothetical protein
MNSLCNSPLPASQTRGGIRNAAANSLTRHARVAGANSLHLFQKGSASFPLNLLDLAQNRIAVSF